MRVGDLGTPKTLIWNLSLRLLPGVLETAYLFPRQHIWTIIWIYELDELERIFRRRKRGCFWPVKRSGFRSHKRGLLGSLQGGRSRSKKIKISDNFETDLANNIFNHFKNKPGQTWREKRERSFGTPQIGLLHTRNLHIGHFLHVDLEDVFGNIEVG